MTNRDTTLNTITENIEIVRYALAFKTTLSVRLYGSICKEDEKELCKIQVLSSYVETLEADLNALGISSDTPLNELDFNQLDPSIVDAVSEIINAVTEAEEYLEDEIIGGESFPDPDFPEIPITYPARNFRVSERTNESLKLVWEHTKKNETVYTIEISYDQGENYETLVENLTDKEYLVTGLTYNTVYYFKIFVQEGTIVEGPVFTFGLTLFNPVTNFQITPNSETELSISWTDTNEGETGYRVDKSADGGSTWEDILLLPSNTTSALDTDVTEDLTYLYRVRAEHDTQLNNSVYVSSSGTPLLNRPTNFQVTGFTNTEVSLQWEDNSNFNENTAVFWKLSSESVYNVDNTFSGTSTTATIQGLAPGLNHDFKVQAIKPSTGNTSLEASLSQYLSLNAPTIIMEVEFPTFKKIVWTDNNTVGLTDRVTLERREDGGSWSMLFTNLDPSGVFEDSSTLQGIQYDYRVRSIGFNGQLSSYASVSGTISNQVILNLTSNLESTDVDSLISVEGVPTNVAMPDGQVIDFGSGDSLNFSASTYGFDGTPKIISIIVDDPEVLTELKLKNLKLSGSLDLTLFNGSVFDVVEIDNNDYVGLTTLNLSTIVLSNSFPSYKLIADVSGTVSLNSSQPLVQIKNFTYGISTSNSYTSLDTRDLGFIFATDDIFGSGFPGSTFNLISADQIQTVTLDAGDVFSSIEIDNCPSLNSINLQDVAIQSQAGPSFSLTDCQNLPLTPFPTFSSPLYTFNLADLPNFVGNLDLSSATFASCCNPSFILDNIGCTSITFPASIGYSFSVLSITNLPNMNSYVLDLSGFETSTKSIVFSADAGSPGQYDCNLTLTDLPNCTKIIAPNKSGPNSSNSLLYNVLIKNMSDLTEIDFNNSGITGRTFEISNCPSLTTTSNFSRGISAFYDFTINNCQNFIIRSRCELLDVFSKWKYYKSTGGPDNGSVDVDKSKTFIDRDYFVNVIDSGYTFNFTNTASSVPINFVGPEVVYTPPSTPLYQNDYEGLPPFRSPRVSGKDVIFDFTNVNGLPANYEYDACCPSPGCAGLGTFSHPSGSYPWVLNFQYGPSQRFEAWQPFSWFTIAGYGWIDAGGNLFTRDT